MIYKVKEQKGARRWALFPCYVVVALLISLGSPAQTCSGDNKVSGYSTSPYIFHTYNELEAGGTAVMYVNAQLSSKKAAFCSNWKLTARATNQFKNGSHSLDLQYVFIHFNTVDGGPNGSDIGIPTNPFQLALSETTIIPRSNVPLDANTRPYFEIKYDMIIQGGAHLLALYNGEYRTNLIFTLYDGHGSVVSTSSPIGLEFQIQYQPSYSSSLMLRNGADNVTLRFNTGADISNGVSVVKNQGMAVTSYSAHQILVKAASSSLIGRGTLNSIPVSTIVLTVNAAATTPRIICFSRPLSVTSQIFVDNPLTDQTYQNVQYDLTFSIAGNDPNIIAAPMGTYTTNIVFVIVPK